MKHEYYTLIDWIKRPALILLFFDSKPVKPKFLVITPFTSIFYNFCVPLVAKLPFSR